MDRYIIAVVVGYMLKVLKSGKEISEYKKEFNAIRHGDFIRFINLVKGPIPFMVTYNEGVITSGNIPPQEDNIAFELLLKSGPSLKIFYANCLLVYGSINDPDVTDEMYEMLAIFEISLRIHASNNKLITVNDLLVTVIDKLGAFKSMPLIDIDKIHLGRRFLNMVKHNKDQFPTLAEGIFSFKIAYEILNQYRLTA